MTGRTAAALIAFCVMVKPVVSRAVEEGGEIPAVTLCLNGTCPTPSPHSALEERQSCGLWMGPSVIKEHEEHGFGLGLYTGRPISKGEIFDETLLVPVFDWDDGHHPPLREYLWQGSNIPKISLTSRTGVFYFIPGVGSFAPCTSVNYNLENRQKYEEREGAPSSPSFGSYSKYESRFYVAARDIVAGEELVPECSDDDFDGGTYELKRYSADGEDEVICLDDKVKIRDATDAHSGRGAFAKRSLRVDEVILSTPVVPVHKSEIISTRGLSSARMPERQLLLNYCFGHPDSPLLLLPNGPLVGYLNHAGDGRLANARIAWHEPRSFPNLTRRQEHHHPELLEMPANRVATMHGKGLMLDIVATRDIGVDEEIFLDYGLEWMKAWKSHLGRWRYDDDSYVSAQRYGEQYDVSVLRTPKEQLMDPYPTNLMFACEFSEDWEDPEPGDFFQRAEFDDWEEDLRCMLPCTVQDRYDTPHYEDGDPIYPDEEEVYHVALIEVDENHDVKFDCLLVHNVEYEILNVPRSAIHLLDRPYTSEAFRPQAFRHKMGVPPGLYPDAWMERKLRRRADGTAGSEDSADLDVVKRKKPRKPIVKKI